MIIYSTIMLGNNAKDIQGFVQWEEGGEVDYKSIAITKTLLVSLILF